MCYLRSRLPPFCVNSATIVFHFRDSGTLKVDTASATWKWNGYRRKWGRLLLTCAAVAYRRNLALTRKLADCQSAAG
jgi:hypothetical protein